MFFVLTYDYAPDVLQKRTPFRADHLALLKELHAAGTILYAGAFDPVTDGALFIFRADSAAEVEAFVKRDPYVKNDVVTGHKVHPWTLVVGG